ncbi:uncharacterized protein Sfp77F [Drosophila takahashii]|uniref:uncharacterized protein Sfp77F n=1 Tax=Drosophila takahashii TaxID=29030 RepID=UPI001CF8F107|nr:uncharacterized protein LOC108063024 [Drosophila takahashii]
MFLQIVFIFLLTFNDVYMLAKRTYLPLRCDETNIYISRPSLMASCLNKEECYIVRPVGHCKNKDDVCCVKKQGFDIDKNEFRD